MGFLRSAVNGADRRRLAYGLRASQATAKAKSSKIPVPA
jgi:hypothetical protein